MNFIFLPHCTGFCRRKECSETETDGCGAGPFCRKQRLVSKGVLYYNDTDMSVKILQQDRKILQKRIMKFSEVITGMDGPCGGSESRIEGGAI